MHGRFRNAAQKGTRHDGQTHHSECERTEVLG